MAEPASIDLSTAAPPRSAPRTADGAGENGLPDDAPHWLLQALARRRLLPAGRWTHRLLTERDLPSEEDEKVSVHTVHEEISRGLCDGLKSHYRGREDVFVAHDLLVYFDGPDMATAARLSPDLFVAFGTPKRARGAFVTWDEDRQPDFVLEILSESTWHKGMERKPGLYQRMGAREYFLFDPHGHARPRLQAWRFEDGGRERLPVAEVADGMLGAYSELLGLHLCHTTPWRLHHEEHPRAGRLRWHDPATGRLLETASDSARRADAESSARLAAERRADTEAEARRALESRVAELEVRLRRG